MFCILKQVCMDKRCVKSLSYAYRIIKYKFLGAYKMRILKNINWMWKRPAIDNRLITVL